MSLSKRKEYFESLEERKYLVAEAMEFLQSAPKVKFNEAIDVAINLGIDPSKSDQNMRGATLLPAGSGKPCKVAVFVEGDEANVQSLKMYTLFSSILIISFTCIYAVTSGSSSNFDF